MVVKSCKHYQCLEYSYLCPTMSINKYQLVSLFFNFSQCLGLLAVINYECSTKPLKSMKRCTSVSFESDTGSKYICDLRQFCLASNRMIKKSPQSDLNSAAGSAALVSCTYPKFQGNVLYL